MADKLITIATYSNISEAYVYKNLLELEGIEVFVADANASLTPPVPSPDEGGVRLSVRESDAAKAISIFNQNKS